MNVVTLDFETYYAPDFTLSKGTTEQYIRDPRFEAIMVAIKHGDSGTVVFPKDQIDKGLDTIDWNNTMLVCHNMMFDGAILGWKYNRFPKVYADTMSMARGLGLQAQVGGSLKALIEWAQNKGYPIQSKGNEVVNALGKRHKDFTFPELQAYADYCKNDVDGTYQLFRIFMEDKRFPVSELKVIDETMRMYCDPLLMLDGGLLKQHLADVLNRKETLLDRVGVSIEEIRSDQKFADLLRQYFIEPPVKVSPKTGKVAYAFSKTDEEFLKLKEHEDEDVQALVECRLGNKSTIEQSRTERFIGIAQRGALPVPLQYYAAHTGRFGGTDKINLQNLPREGVMRKAIMAPPGHLLVVADSAQIEARIVAWLAMELGLIEAFASGVDIYSIFATDIFGVQVTKKDKERRFVGKTSILGLGFEMGGVKLQRTLSRGMGGVRFEMDIKDATGIVQLYRDKYKNVAGLWKQGTAALGGLVAGESAAFGRAGVVVMAPPDAVEDIPRVILPNGMCVRYIGLREEAGDKGPQFVYQVKEGRKVYETRIYGGKLTENVVQALARIVITDQWMKIKARAIKERVFHRSPVVGQVHDELICCVPEAAAEDMKAIMMEEMHRAPSWAEGLPVACEAHIAERYGDAK